MDESQRQTLRKRLKALRAEERSAIGREDYLAADFAGGEIRGIRYVIDVLGEEL